MVAFSFFIIFSSHQSKAFFLSLFLYFLHLFNRSSVFLSIFLSTKNLSFFSNLSFCVSFFLFHLPICPKRKCYLALSLFVRWKRKEELQQKMLVLLLLLLLSLLLLLLFPPRLNIFVYIFTEVLSYSVSPSQNLPCSRIKHSYEE